MRGTWCGLLVSLLLFPGLASAQRSRWSFEGNERVQRPLTGRGDVVGRVFEDRDKDGRVDPDEPGIAEVSVILDGGHVVVTDAQGRFHFPGVEARQHALQVSGASLPAGAIGVPAPSIVEVPPSAVARVEIPVVLEFQRMEIGQPRITGYRAFPQWAELPVNIVGNATDIQGLANGKRLTFPSAELKIRGVGRGELVDAGSAAKVEFDPQVKHAGKSTAWSLEIVTPDGTLRRKISGTGEAPDRVPFDGKDGEGKAFTKPEALAARFCADFDDTTRACSPFRAFGFTTGKGRKTKRPTLVTPTSPPSAVANGKTFTLDKDGSFIDGVLPDENRRITVALTRDDGRMATATFTIPEVKLTRGGEPFEVQFGQSTDTYIAPRRPGTITVFLQGTAPGDAELEIDGKLFNREGGKWSHDLQVPLGKHRADIIVNSADGWNTIYEMNWVLGKETPDGEPIILQEKIPSLQVLLPAKEARIPHRLVQIQGNAEVGATLTANGKPVKLGEQGEFHTEVAVDPADGKLELVVTDPEGREGRLERSWDVTPGSSGALGFIDAEPFLVLDHDAGELGFGGQGSGSFSGFVLGEDGTLFWGGLEVGPEPRAGTPTVAGAPDPMAGVQALGGMELMLGDSLRFGATYEGDVYAGPVGLPMSHGLTLAFAWTTDAVDVMLDAGGRFVMSGYDAPESNGLIAGGGLGARVALVDALDFRARVGAGVGLLGEAGSPPEHLVGSAQLLWRPDAGPTVALAYDHRIDGTAVTADNPGFAGPTGGVASLSLTWALSPAVRLVEGAGFWVEAVRVHNVTRLEIAASDSTLIALGYQADYAGALEHGPLAELDLGLGDLLRAGVVYELVLRSDGGGMLSRARLRLQAAF